MKSIRWWLYAPFRWNHRRKWRRTSVFVEVHLLDGNYDGMPRSPGWAVNCEDVAEQALKVVRRLGISSHEAAVAVGAGAASLGQSVDSWSIDRSWRLVPTRYGGAWPR